MPDKPAPEIVSGFQRLSADEARQFATVVAELAGAGLPLSSGLRAAAQEAPSGRLARAFRRVASQLDEGRPLDVVLADPKSPLPQHVAGLLAAGLKSGRLAPALADFLEQQRTAFELRRSAGAALAYPALLFIILLALYAFFSFFVVGQFQQMFEEFELRLSPWVKAVMWAGTTGVRLLLAGIAACVVVMVVLRVVLGRARWQQFISTAPMIGPIWHWSGVAEATRLWALLVDQEIPVPTALALVGQGVLNADIGQACRRLARESESGQPLSELLAANSRLPPLLAPMVRWGEATGALAAALLSVSEAFEVRARRRIEIVRIVAPPIMFLLVGSSVAFVVLGLIAPLISLITGLSQ